MDIPIDEQLAVPVFEQIRSFLAGAILLGTISPGEQLPAVRELADQLGIAIGTVTRAYQELQRAGMVRSRPRTGTVVTRGAGVVGADVGSAATRLIVRGNSAGLTAQQLVDIVRAAHSR